MVPYSSVILNFETKHLLLGLLCTYVFPNEAVTVPLIRPGICRHLVAMCTHWFIKIMHSMEWSSRFSVRTINEMITISQITHPVTGLVFSDSWNSVFKTSNWDTRQLYGSILSLLTGKVQWRMIIWISQSPNDVFRLLVVLNYSSNTYGSWYKAVKSSKSWLIYMTNVHRLKVAAGFSHK